MTARHWVRAWVMVWALAATGCGVGYHASYHKVSAAPQQGAATGFGPDRLGFKTSGLVHEVTVYDRTGILLAVFGTAANAAKARNEEIKNMAKEGRTRGSYTYEVTPVIPGPEVRFSARFGGASDFDVDLTGQTTSGSGDVSLRGLSFGLDFGKIKFHQRVYMDFGFEGHFFRNYHATAGDTAIGPLGAGETIKRDTFYIPVIARVHYLVTPTIRATVQGEYDPLQSLLGALLGRGHLYGGKAYATVSILPWLMADAGVGIDSLSTGADEFRSRTNDLAVWAGLRVDKL